jgi:iron complex transport system substrate-binding protein
VRVVSLLPAATDAIVALGAVETLVGVSHECDARAVAGLPRVTGTPVETAGGARDVDAQVRRLAAEGAPLFTLDEAAIAALRPDVLFTQSVCEVCAVREEDVRALAARLRPQPRVVTLGATTLEGVLEDVARVGAALEGAGEPAELIAGMRARLRHVHDRLKAAEAPRPRIAIIEWTDPLFAAGHWAPDLVRRAGGTDVLAKAGEHSRERPAAEIQAADPEILVIAPCGYSLQRSAQAARVLIAAAEWRWARERPLWALDANRLLSRPGPGLVDGALTLAAILHPTLFAAPDAASAIRVTSR